MAQPKKRGLGCKLAVGALVLVVACALALTVINLVDTSLRRVGLLPTRTPTPTATFTPIPTDTPIPTSTPTPLPSTNTPAPTDTPRATNLSPEIQLYISEVTKNGQTLGEALNNLGTLLQDPNIGDTTWRTNVATQAAIIQLTHQELTEVSVPTEMMEIHTSLLDGTADCNLAMDYLMQGINDLDRGDIDRANELITSCGHKTSAATDLLAEYISPSPQSPMTPIQGPKIPVTVLVEPMSVYSGPDWSSEVIWAAYQDNPIYAVARNPDDTWIKIIQEDKQGWISAGNVEIPEGMETLPVITPTPIPPTPAPIPPTAPPSQPAGGYTGPYDPHGPDRDCSDFSTHAEAQAFYEAAGGPAQDRHRLDHDRNGIACEDLP